MAGQTHLDELVDYKVKILNVLRSSQKIVGLIANDPNVDMDSDEAYTIQEENFYDYPYVDETVQEASAFIMVDVEMAELSSPAMKNIVIYIQPVCNKEYVRLNARDFPGVKGNRLDNLCREIDYLLRGSRDYGIGVLQLDNAVVSSVPSKFTSRILTYTVPSFAYGRGAYSD